ncbi:MAG: alpha/beta hydrolase [Promethearchaeota archaeon]
MAYLEVAKVHPKLGALLEKDAKFSTKVAEEFAAKHSVSVEDITSMRVDGTLLLAMHRYIDTVIAFEDNKHIPNDVTFERVDAGGVESEWTYVPDANEKKVFFHLFGGGYIIGNLDSRRWSAYLYTRETKIRCLNVGYRLAPEHPYPAALEDSITAYKWLLTQNIDPKNVIICGESAGGGLTMATLLKLRDLELPMPAAAVMQSPWVDLRRRGKSLKTFYKYEPELASLVNVITLLYAGSNNQGNPYVSPVYADLKDLPPLLIQAGGIEVIRDDAILLAERAKSSGVKVSLEIYEGMTHVFQNYADKLEESIDAWKSIAKFVEKYLD